jgi:dihydroorotase
VNKITLPAFTDAHVHLRQDAMTSVVAPYSARCCARVIAMPNLDPPIHSPESIGAARLMYEQALGDKTRVYLTAKLLATTTPKDVTAAAEAGVIGFKLYPSGVTTNSEDGIPYIRLMFKKDDVAAVFAEMERLDLVLLCHGESDGHVMDREDEFLEEVFPWIRTRFPHLRMTLEHITTWAGIEAVKRADHKNPGKTLGTITLHHMETTLDDVIGGKLRPHLFCKPIPKKEWDRDALREAAFGHDAFAFGSDSAPHPVGSKECGAGCAGVFTAPVLAECLTYLAEMSDLADWRVNLEEFTSRRANKFYRFGDNKWQITLFKQRHPVPPVCGGVVPYKAGEYLDWQLEEPT